MENKWEENDLPYSDLWEVSSDSFRLLPHNFQWFCILKIYFSNHLCQCLRVLLIEVERANIVNAIVTIK